MHLFTDVSKKLTLYIIFDEITSINQRRWEDGFLIELVLIDLIKKTEKYLDKK